MTARKLGIVYILALSLVMLFLSSMANAQTPPTATATAASFVNTGPGPTTGATGIVVAGGSDYQWAAFQFTLSDPAAITQVQGWFGAQIGPPDTPCNSPCTVNVVIRENNDFDPSAPLPGASIWSQTYTVTPPTTNSAWITFSNYTAVLAAGTYWVAFEPPVNSGLDVGFGGPPSGTGTGVKLLPEASYAWYSEGNGGYINYVNGPPNPTLPAVTVSGYDLGTSLGSPLITSGTFARTITSGTVFNIFPFTQDGTAIGGVGQADTSQWNIYSPAAVANAYGTISANPNTQGDILTAGAYSATGTGDSGAARGIVFSTFLNTTGKAIPKLKVNAALDGSIVSTDSNSPVTVTAAVYVFDPVDFTSEINSNVPGPNSTCGSNCPYLSLAQFLLGGSNLVVGDGAVGSYYYDLTDLFDNFADDSWLSNTSTKFPLVCTGACTAEASTVGTAIPVNGLFTVMFDVMAASEGSNSAQSQAIGDFLSTLQADLTHGLFTDGTSANNGLGNPISGIVGPIATTLPDAPASIALSPGSTTSQVGSTVTLTAAVTDATGNPVPNAFVRFVFASTGPHAGSGGPAGTPIGTDQFGNATLSFTDTLGKAGTDSITANIGSLQAPTTATITWTSPGPLYSITLSPNPGTITLPNSQTYTATGSDIFGNPITTDASGEPTFTISPDGTCVGNTCTPTASGMHTVTGSYNYPLIGTTVSGTATLNVNSATATTVTATAPSGSYGYGAAPTLASLSPAYSPSVTPTTPATCAATPGGSYTYPAVGTYTINCTGEALANYTFSNVAGTITVTAATVTATAPSGSYGYGAAPTLASLSPAYSPSVTPTTPATCAATPGGSYTYPAVGTYTINCTGEALANYTFSNVAGTITVTAATVTATAPSGSYGYGAAPTLASLSPAYSPSVTPTTPATCAATPGGSYTYPAVGTYTINCTGEALANCTFSNVAGTITVTAATVTATAPSGSYGYGAAPTLASLSPAYSPSVTPTTPATCAATPGGSYTYPAVGTYTINCTGEALANYTFSNVAGTITVTAATVTATAPSGSYGYGAAPTLASLSPAYSPSVTPTTPATCAATPGGSYTYPAVGTYTINCTGEALANYTFSNVAGTITVTAATVTATAPSGSYVYGAAPTLASLSPAYSPSVTPTTPATCAATPGGSYTYPAAGTYTINCSGEAATNYTFTNKSGTITITPEPVTITASNTSMTFGTTPPTPTAEYTYGSVTLSATGPAGLTAPTCVTSATNMTPVGTDTGANTCSGASGSNYTISYVAGNVVVNAATGATFKLIAQPSTETIKRGVLAAFLLEAQSVNSFSGNVKITCSGGPAGSMCGEFPQTVNLQPNKTAIALSGALFPANTTPGTYTLTFTGTSGALVVSTTAQFKVED